MRAVFAVALWLFVGSAAFCEDISAIFANPKKFESKRVTLTGIAVGDWPEFEIYESVDAARRGVNGRPLHVDAERSEHSDVVYDMHRLLIVGTVNDLGLDSWGFRTVNVTAQKVEVISSQLAVLEPSSVVVRNDAGENVTIRIFAHPYAQSPMQKNEYLTLPFSSGVIEVTSRRGKVLARKTISNVHESQYYDAKHGVIYGLITSSGLSFVPSDRAKDWRRKAILDQYNISKAYLKSLEKK